MNSTVRTTFAWLSTTPRGRPVLPDVYWMKATSSVSAAGDGGAGACLPSQLRGGGGGAVCGCPGRPAPRSARSGWRRGALLASRAAFWRMRSGGEVFSTLAAEGDQVKGLGVGVALRLAELGAALA